jgi:parvulin-like peptidyl-prolyl isomerase
MIKFSELKKVIFVLSLVLVGQLSAKRKLLDKIVVRVNGANILSSDLKKKRIIKNGETFTLDEAILDELLFQKAAEKKLLPTDVEVEKQIVSLKVNNGLGDLTEKQFEEELQKEGFGLSEYKTQVAKMFAVERFKQAEFSERVVVTAQEVEEEYKKNPIKIQEKYSLQICDLPKGSVDEKGQLVKKNDLKWEDIGWVPRSELSSQLRFVSKMEKGKTSKPFKDGNVYRLVKLVDKESERTKKLDESYLELEHSIFDEKRNTFEKEFEKELKNKATIVYLDASLNKLA